jgi:hypothetical protein
VSVKLSLRFLGQKVVPLGKADNFAKLNVKVQVDTFRINKPDQIFADEVHSLCDAGHSSLV